MVVGTALLGFSEKFIALLESVDDVAIEPVRLGLLLHSLVFKREESIDYALENIVPGINNVIRIIKNKRRIPRRLFQCSNKLSLAKRPAMCIPHLPTGQERGMKIRLTRYCKKFPEYCQPRKNIPFECYRFNLRA